MLCRAHVNNIVNKCWNFRRFAQRHFSIDNLDKPLLFVIEFLKKDFFNFEKVNLGMLFTCHSFSSLNKTHTHIHIYIPNNIIYFFHHVSRANEISNIKTFEIFIKFLLPYILIINVAVVFYLKIVFFFFCKKKPRPLSEVMSIISDIFKYLIQRVFNNIVNVIHDTWSKCMQLNYWNIMFRHALLV